MRRRRYARKSFKPRRKSFRRSFRSRKITRQFTKPDGVNSLKFTLSQDVVYAGLASVFHIGWHSNFVVAGSLQCNDCPEFAVTASLYELQKTKGVKIIWEPVGNDNLPANRYVKCIHIGSFPNESVANLIAGPPTINKLSQRLDYKCY